MYRKTKPKQRWTKKMLLIKLTTLLSNACSLNTELIKFLYSISSDNEHTAIQVAKNIKHIKQVKLKQI